MTKICLSILALALFACSSTPKVTAADTRIPVSPDAYTADAFFAEKADRRAPASSPASGGGGYGAACLDAIKKCQVKEHRDCEATEVSSRVPQDDGSFKVTVHCSAVPR